MKIFTAGLVTESSDLVSAPTTMKDWKIECNAGLLINRSPFRELLVLFRMMALDKGWEVCESICATSLPPGGRTIRPVYEKIRSMILNDLQRSMPVDAILLQLHGAALAYGYDDCEGDLLEHIRSVTGPDIPIGIELDPHCHLSQKMMEHSTAIVLYKTFLHTDMTERAVELFNIIAGTLEGRVRPVMALFDCKMVDRPVDEAHQPMKSYLETIFEREKEPGILSISLVHGCPLAAVADLGNKVLVVCDDDRDLASKTAEDLGLMFFGLRGQQSQYLDVQEALDQAQDRVRLGEKAVQLLEWGDLAGGGFPTDATELIEAMFNRGMINLAVGLMCDPLAVTICHAVGAGERIKLRVGGKASQCSGNPLDLDVLVKRTFQKATISTRLGNQNLGDVAIVICGESEFLLTSERVLGYGPEDFKQLGVDPDTKKYIVLKHFCDNNHINVWSANLDVSEWPTPNITRPRWPWDESPFGSNH